MRRRRSGGWKALRHDVLFYGTGHEAWDGGGGWAARGVGGGLAWAVAWRGQWLGRRATCGQNLPGCVPGVGSCTLRAALVVRPISDEVCFFWLNRVFSFITEQR